MGHVLQSLLTGGKSKNGQTQGRRNVQSPPLFFGRFPNSIPIRWGSRSCSPYKLVPSKIFDIPAPLKLPNVSASSNESSNPLANRNGRVCSSLTSQGPFNYYVDKMWGRVGQKMSVFVHAQRIKTVYAGALCVQMDFSRTFEANTKCNNINYV